MTAEPDPDEEYENRAEQRERGDAIRGGTDLKRLVTR
jgi:hypothetical protein